jgi:ribosomal protein L11 methyltransferase
MHIDPQEVSCGSFIFMMTPIQWIEVSLLVDGELAEAVAEVFSRFAPQGVVIESTAITPDPEGEGSPSGPLRVCAYLPVDQELEQKRQRLEEALWYLGRISPLPTSQFRPVEEIDWVTVWKQHYQPIPIGERLIILPVWIEDYPAQRIPIRIDPGMAFGTGTHPTTQLCLQLAEDIFKAAGQSGTPLDLFDIGCGSGILSIAGIKLGARHAIGVDIDHQAIENAHQNVMVNGVADRIELGVGSVPELLAGNFSLRQATIIFANILANVITQLFSEGLAELLAPGGSLILSGILEGQSLDVENSAREHGLVITKRLQMGDWVALVADKPTP